MATEVTKQKHSMPAEVTAQIIQNLREYGDFMKPGYGMGYNATSKTNYQWSAENMARWAAYDAIQPEDRPTGFVLDQTAKDMGYRIKKDSKPLEIFRKDITGEFVNSKYFNLADLIATKKVADPIKPLPRSGDTEADYKLAGDMCEALNIDRSAADKGDAAAILAAVTQYAQKESVERDNKKTPVSEIPAKLTASIFLRKHNILPPAQPLLTEAQINLLEANPKELSDALRISASLYKKMDKAYYMATHKDFAESKAPSFDINTYLDKNSWEPKDWKDVTYHYLENLPSGKDIKEFDLEIAKKMAVDGLSDKRMMSILESINHLNGYDGPDVSIDVVNSQEFQNFRKDFKPHLSKEGQKWKELNEVKAILKKAKFDKGDWDKLAYHYNIPLKEGMDIKEHNLRVAKRMARAGISDGQMGVILKIVNRYNKYNGQDVTADVIKSKELKAFREELKQEAAQKKDQKQTQGKAKVMAK